MQIRKVLRQERKFVISMEQFYRFDGELACLLKPDAHNGPEGYMVRSLYFDTLMDKDYYDKLAGVELHRKMRLRIYSPDSDDALLEMKQKQGTNQLKRSLIVSRADAKRIATGDYEPLLAYSEPFAAECYGVLTMGCYMPRVVVEYRRKAYVLPENDIRITFDSQIRASSLTGNMFDRHPGLFPVMHPADVVLEIKYNHFLLAYVKDIMRVCNRSETAVSKYTLARAGRISF